MHQHYTKMYGNKIIYHRYRYTYYWVTYDRFIYITIIYLQISLVFIKYNIS